MGTFARRGGGLLSGGRGATPLVAAIVTAAGVLAIALALQASLGRSLIAAAVLGLAAAGIASVVGLRSGTRRGLLVAGAVLAAVLLYLVVAVMFFSH